jgi:hypothetical protein
MFQNNLRQSDAIYRSVEADHADLSAFNPGGFDGKRKPKGFTVEPPIDDQGNVTGPAAPKLSAWLWSPWYAKLWWAAVPVWWLGVAASSRLNALEIFYRGALAGYLNILFFPMTALMVLGVGYVRERLDGFAGPGDGTRLSDEEALAVTTRVWEEHDRAMEDLAATTDMFDPRSGVLWIGNPLNPLNPGYIDPHTGKHR